MSWLDTVAYCLGDKDAYELMQFAHDRGLVEAGAAHGLTQVEVMSICAYTSGRKIERYSVFELVNLALRFPKSNMQFIELVDPLVQNLKSALVKLPSFEGDVYRFTFLPEDVLKAARNLKVFEDAGFLSASEDPDSFTGRDFLVIRSLTGRRISEFSVFAQEHEVLFPARARFEVEELDTTANGAILLLNEVVDG